MHLHGSRPEGLKRLSLRHNLGLQLLALYVLFIGPVMVGALIFDALTRQSLQEDVQAADLALAYAIALETEATLGNAARTVENLARHPSVLAGDQAAMRALFADIALARADVNLLYRLDADGVMLYHYPEGPTSTVGVSFAFREYFQEALLRCGPLFSSGRISPTTGKPVATAVMPLRWPAGDCSQPGGEGEFIGLVASNLGLEKLSDTLLVISGVEPPDLNISIIDAGGQVIAHPGLVDASIPAEAMLTVRSGDDLGLPDALLPDWGDWQDGVVDQVLAGHTGTQISTAPDQSTWVRSYVPIPVAGWGVIVQRPTQAAFATILRFHRLLLVAIGIYLAGGLFFWLALSRRVIVPLERLAEFSRRVGLPGRTGAWRDMALEPWSGRDDQVGRLARALAAMAEHIEQRLEELSTLLETSRAVVSSLDASEVLNSILDQVQRLLDVERCAIVTLDERLDVFRISASRGLSDEYVRRLRIEPGEPHSAAMRALRSQRPVQITDIETETTYGAFYERARTEGFRSLLAVPLITQHAQPAVLLLYRGEPYRYADADLELVSSFANHAAMATEHAALFARSDAQLQEQTGRLEAIVESLDDGLILESLDGAVLFCNQRAADLLGIRRSVARQHRVETLITTLMHTVEEPERASAALRAAMVERGARTVDLTRRQGKDYQDLRIHLFDVTDARGEPIGRGQIWQDITGDKSLDRMKSALLSTVSHELRTPLAAIKGYATTLLAQDVQWDAAAQREFMHTISEEADRLAVLVSNLLDLSRLEGGALHIDRDLYAVDDLLRQAAHRDSAELGARLRLDLPPNLPLVWIDRPRLETVLRNLLENAARYAPPESPVELSAQQRNGQIIITVRDYGAGVPKEQQDRIFDRFYRGDIERGRRVGGAGLGLAICKGFVEAHGGRIWVEDGYPGAVFAFSLPTNTPDFEQRHDPNPTHPGRG